MVSEPESASSLVERLLARDRRALARAVSLVEAHDPIGDEILRAVFPHTGAAEIVGVTGPPGAGKSTLIGQLLKLERARGRSVAVLTVDPSSPFTHGALLGDRIRLDEHFLDPGVFIRSMASRGALGGLSAATLQAALLMDAAGHDVVVLETVGVGQSEIGVVNHADTVVLVLMPGSGDSVQALKAGVMEIPDVVVVNKSDHPSADVFVRELRSVLRLKPRSPSSWPVPLIKTSALTGEGVSELLASVDAHRAHLHDSGAGAERRARNLRGQVLTLASEQLRAQLEAATATDARLQALLERVVARELDPATAARLILEQAGLT